MAAAQTKPAQSNGILPVPASQTFQAAGKSGSGKTPAVKLKVVVRRLAPTLPEVDFIKTVGNEWSLGQGKVDWFSYKPGKESKDPAKPSRPSRAYLHLTHSDHLIKLADTIRTAKFGYVQDAWDNATQGRPTTEFAPYSRIPGGRKRTDARQGTIDQDPEFMDFLESLANPVSKETAPEESTDSALAKPEKITMTPLVQYLKDKKASKAKESAAKQASKHSRHDSGSQATSKTKDGDDTKRKGKDGKASRSTEKSSKDTPRLLKKDAGDKPAGNTKKTAQESSRGSKAPRERGNISAAAQILQRDLGLAPANSRRAKAAAEKASSESKAEATAKPDPDKKGTSAGSKSGTGKGRNRGGADSESRKTRENHKASKDEAAKSTPGPIVLLKKSDGQQNASSTATPPKSSTNASGSSKKQTAATAPSAGATRAFVKHANPSQGVTEQLLREAMETFGAVSHVEIDKRKGFAYVDFVDHEGLVKAIAANPTKVAQGTVQVLERKETRPARETPANRGGGGGGGGGGGSGGNGNNNSTGGGGSGSGTSRGGRGGSNRRGGRQGGRGGAAAAAATAATSDAPGAAK